MLRSYVFVCAHLTVAMQRQRKTPLEINGFHMLSLGVLIHQLYVALSQKPGLSTQLDLNRLAAQKDFSLLYVDCLCHFISSIHQQAHFCLLFAYKLCVKFKCLQ